jgi:uncharacterized protein (DUF1330 family)
MAAYVIADIEVTDQPGYEEYRQAVPATIERYGGRYLARGGLVESLEGDWQPRRLVILQFESVERAREWWASQEYSGPKGIRQRTSTGKLLLVEGL